LATSSIIQNPTGFNTNGDIGYYSSLFIFVATYSLFVKCFFTCHIFYLAAYQAIQCISFNSLSVGCL